MHDKEFPNKVWNQARISQLIKQIDTDGTTVRKPGSGRPKSDRKRQYIQHVSELVCSKKDHPHSHKTPLEIERETSIPRTTM